MLVPAVFSRRTGFALGLLALTRSGGARPTLLPGHPTSRNSHALAHRPALPYGSEVAVSNRFGTTAIPLALPGAPTLPTPKCE